MMPWDRARDLGFDTFRLDQARGVLLDACGAERRLRPKSLALLHYLLDHPGHLLGRNELLEVLWPGVIVTDDSLTQCVSELRQAFGSRAAAVLQTVHKRGYVLTAEVRQDAPVRKHGPAPGTPPPPVFSGGLAGLRRETMMVCRLEVPGGDPACILLADGLASDLTAALTCLEGLRVRPASDCDPDQGFRIRGEIRVMGEELRVTIRLEEAATGIALWAKRFSHARGGTPELPATDLVALVVHLGQQVDRHSLAAARQKPVASLSARELHLIGRDHHQRGTEADTRLAEEMFKAAMLLDPDYPHAFAWQAYTVSRAVTHGWGRLDEQAALGEMLGLARQAVQIDPTSPLCLSRLAFALMLHQQWDDAVVTAHAALQSDRPAFTAARNTCCEVLTQAGYAREAVAIARGTLALDPLCSPITQGLLGRALLLAGDTKDALQALHWCASRLPDFAPTFDTLVVAGLDAGRAAEAVSAWKQVLRLRPGWTPVNHTGLWCFRRNEDLARFQAAYCYVATLADLPGVDATPLAGLDVSSGPAVHQNRNLQDPRTF